ncbi:MAG: S9 family peptidase [Terracidiphilus sp.]|jgi:dipeptidyl aminopeptidase/acylaminoacyl peptidase
MKSPLIRASLCAGVIALLLNAAFPPSIAQAQASTSPERAHIEEILRGLIRGHSFGQVAISPDGHRLAWIERMKEGAEIRVASLSDLKKSERITAAAKPEQHCREGQIAWSPDSQSLAFFSDCAKLGQSDLYLSRLDGNSAHRLTELNGYIEAPAFSPDATSVAFLYVEGATRPAGAMAAMKPPSGVIGEEGAEIQRIAIARVGAVKPQAPEWASPPELHIYDFDWRPDSKGFAYIAADPPGENNWWVAKLYTQEFTRVPNAVLAPAEVAGPLHGLQIAVPRWSPDAKSIAFIGGLMSDQGETGGDVWIVPATGGLPRNLTPRRHTSPAWIEWAGSDALFVSELARGNAQLILLRLSSEKDGELEAMVHGPVFCIPASVGDGRIEMSLSATADHSLFAFIASSFDRPMEIYSAEPEKVMDSCMGSDSANVKQLTHINDGIEPAWGKSVSLNWKSENFNVQGWLTLPKDYDPAKKYPLIVEVHGGPAAAEEPRWGGSFGLTSTIFSALGYFVLQPNPRGSFGQGEEFVQVIRKDFGYGDLRDILAGLDAVEAKYPVDPNRVGLTGWSYGGFITMFAVTQTQRFKAAVAGAGVSNWQSYYGENSIDQWMTPYFGASVYDDPAVYAKSSAINYIQQAKTPTLIVVGDRDGECPAPQSYEFWHALRSRHVPTRLVVYPNEGHMFSNPAHQWDVVEQAVEWFARYLPPAQ